MQTLKESLVAYARTLVVIWQSGALAVLGMFLLTLLPGVVPACQFFVTERLVNAITDAVGDANWWHAVLPWLIGLLGLRILNTGADLLREPLYSHLGENIEIWINEGIAPESRHNSVNRNTNRRISRFTGTGTRCLRTRAPEYPLASR